MIRRALFLMIVAFSDTICRGDQTSAESAPIQKRPDLLTAVVGDIRVRIDGPKLWTLSGFDHRDNVIAVEESAYGYVVNFSGGGFLGSAHFLDVPGKPGEIEKENVTRVRFFLDQMPLKDLADALSVSGTSFRLERDSTIRGIQLNSSVTVSDNVLVETARIRAAADVDVTLVYPMMYAWTPQATAFLFGDDQGIQKRGQFLEPNAKPSEGLEKAARWMAVYNRTSGLAAVCYVVKQPHQEDAWLQYTDAPGVYRKLRLMSFSEKTIPAGFDGTFQTAVTFFSASEDHWEQEAWQKIPKIKSSAVGVVVP